jgi:hypothetical protein
MKIDCSGALTIVLCLWVIFGISKSVLLADTHCNKI